MEKDISYNGVYPTLSEPFRHPNSKTHRLRRIFHPPTGGYRIFPPPKSLGLIFRDMDVLNTFHSVLGDLHFDLNQTHCINGISIKTNEGSMINHDNKNKRIGFVCFSLLLLIFLSQCQRVGEMQTQEPRIDEQEQPATESIDREIVAFLSDYLGNLTTKRNFSGVVLFARVENVLFYRAYGWASRRYDAANNTDTRFNLASASKMFTSVLIARLVEESRLSFNDPIGNYLNTDWVSNEVGDKVQIRHLLSHTSGLGHYWDTWDKYSDTLLELNDYKAIITDELAFEPGTDWQYSNSGFLLLGVIIEEVTGKAYYEHLQEEIFESVGMADTGFYKLDEPHENLATGYFEDEEDGGKLKNNTIMQGIRGSSAGGGWSTAADLLRFFLALRSNELVSSEMKEILWTPKPMSPKYGYGFQIKENWVGHWGGFPGIEAFVMYFPASDHTFIVLSNYYDSALPLMDKMDS
jgi:CubicO group peptidase (beta-lactamase class C family)